MPRNGSGLYKLPPGINPVVPNTVISSSWANTTLNDMAAALTNSVASDGQTPMTANLPMGGNRVVGMADPVDSQDAVTLGFLDTKSFDRIGISGWRRPESGEYPLMVKSGSYSINVPGGSGVVIDPLDGSVNVTWAAQNVVLSDVNGSWSTTIGVDSYGNVTQLSGVNNSEWGREYIILGSVSHPNGKIDKVINSPSILGGVAYSMYDVGTALQNTVVDGGRVHAASDNGVGVAIDAKTVFYMGVSANDVRNPNFASVALQDGVSMFPITGTGTVSSPVLSIPVSKYDPDGAGVIEDIPGAATVSTIWRLYELSGSYLLQYGQHWYDTLVEAVGAVWTEQVVTPAKLAGATMVAVLVITKSATNIDDPSSSAIISNPGSGGGESSPIDSGQTSGASYNVIFDISEDTTLDGTYRNSFIVVNSPVAVDLTVRTNTGDDDLDWLQGDCFTVLQAGPGPVNFLSEAGSTIVPPVLLDPRTRGLGSTASCTCWAPDTGSWSASGDLFRPTTTPIKETYVVPDRTVLSGSNCTVGVTKGNLILPHNFALDPDPSTGLFCSLMVAQTTGSVFTVDVKVNGVSVLSTPLTVDNNNKSSHGSAVSVQYSPAFIASNRLIPAGSELSWDVTQLGTALAKGASLVVTGQRA